MSGRGGQGRGKMMQKIKFKQAVVVLAVLASGAAYAQSNVTLYGRVNTTVERQKTGDATVTGVFNNASRFGFVGTEDLGGGLKAGFQLESGFNSDTGAAATTFFGRRSEVNLSGGFGTVRLGRFFAESYFATADYVSMHNHDTGSSSDALYAYVMRDSNKVAYRTPSIANLTVEAALGMHEQIKNTPAAAGANGKYAKDLAANYKLGALELGAGYTHLDVARQAAFRALYTVGPFIVGGYYQRDKNAYVVNGGERNNLRLAGAYLFGASELHLNVGRADSYKNLSDSGATQATIAYNYKLSKRTKVYAYYTRVNNERNGLYNVGTAGQNFSSVAAGIRHNF